MKNSTILLIAIIIIAGGLLAWWAGRDTAPSADITAGLSDTAVTDEGVGVADPTDDDVPVSANGDAGESDMDGGEMAEPTVVRYTADGFTPSTVTITTGQSIRFVNETNDPMWVASDAHPTHTEYSGTSRGEHCTPGSTVDAFDQCENGSIYTFTFDRSGTWEYHNHLNPSDAGAVAVQ